MGEPEIGEKGIGQTGGAAGGRAEASVLARRLAGDMPCARCGYNLKSMSVRAVCPECGTPVRLTILAVVDPFATVLRPIDRPRLVGLGLIAWSVCGAAAALLSWLPRVSDALGEFVGVYLAVRDAPVATVACMAISGVGALALVRPHGGLPARDVAASAIACVLYLPLAWLHWLIHVSIDRFPPAPYLDSAGPSPDRTVARIAFLVVLSLILLGLRRNARVLAARSMLLRTGRVDRQTLLAMAVACGVALLGDLLHLTRGAIEWIPEEVAWVAGTSMIGIGSLLLTIGAIGTAIDSIRIARVLVRPAPSLEQATTAEE